MSFRLLGLTPKGVFFDKEVDEALFPTDKGPLGIFTGYAPIYFSLAPAGVLKIVENGSNHYYAIFGGIVENRDAVCTILTDDIEDSMDIDMATAISARDRAKDILKGEDPNADVAQAALLLGHSVALINAKNLGEGGGKQ